MTASISVVKGTGWMTCPTQVNCLRHRQTYGAKDAVRLWPKSATQSVVPSDTRDTRTFQTAGVVSRG